MILVTGGTGLVGRHLLLALTEDDTPVRAIYRTQEKVDDVQKYFAFAKAESRFSKIEWYRADLLDIPKLEDAFKAITHVYHCAALISFDPYLFETLKKTNIEGTANIVNLSIAHNIKKLCYLSSIATLSDKPSNPITEENHWDPNTNNSVYAISKYGAEMEVWRGSQEGLDIIIFNPGIVLGEGNYNSGSGLLFQKVYNGLKYYPKGGSSFVDVWDVVNIMVMGMQSNVVKERFILSGENASHQSVLEKIASGIGKKASKKPLPDWMLRIGYSLDYLRGVFTKKRHLTKIDAQSIQKNKVFSSQKAIELLNYTPSPIEMSITRIAAHFNAVAGARD